MPAMSPAQIVTEIQDDMLKRDPPLTRPSDVKVLLDKLRAFTDQVKATRLVEQEKGNIAPAANLQIQAALDIWEALLAYYEQEVAKAAPDDRAAIDRNVTAPLMVGYCYGYPSCGAQGAVFDPPIAIAPRAADPFIILSMLHVATEADAQNTFLSALGSVMQERWEQVKKGAGELVRAVKKTGQSILTPVLVGVGIVGGVAGLVWLTRRVRAA